MTERSVVYGAQSQKAIFRLAECLLLALLALFLARAALTWAAVILAGAAGLIALCIEPAVGLITVALLIPVGGLARLPLPGVNAVDLLVVLTVAAWLAQGVARRRIVFRPPPLTWPLLAFVWIAGLSLTQADSWREGLPEWLKWAEFAALYLVASQILDRKRLAWVLVALFVAGLAETALGLYQFVRQVGPEAFVLDGRFMRAYGTFQQPNPYAGYLGYLAPVAASLALGGLGQWWRERSRPSTPQRKTRRSAQDASAQPESSLQAVGCANASNRLKPRLQMGTPRQVEDAGVPNLFGRFSGRTGGFGSFLVGLACGLVAIALAAGIGASWSRGGWLGLTAALVAVVALRSRRTAIVTVAALVALILVVTVVGTAWLPGSIAARLADLGNYLVGPDPALTEINDANFAVLERLAHWQAGLRMFDDHPWLGVGIGNYGVAYPRYALPHWYDALGHAHNIYVNFLAETGLLGAAAFALFWLGLAWYTLRKSLLLPPVSDRAAGARSEARPEDKESGLYSSLAIGILGAVIYLSVHNIFDNLFVQHLQLQLALLMGGLAAMARKCASNLTASILRGIF